jgi:hypothetical protein
MEHTPTFTVQPTSIEGFSIIQWGITPWGGADRDLQVETSIATLWASAPDLLVALKEAHSWLNWFLGTSMAEQYAVMRGSVGDEWIAQIKGTRNASQAAIEKAEPT